MHVRITPLGDSAITVFFGDTIDEETSRQVFSVFNYLQQLNSDCIKDVIPAYASLSVIYDLVKIKKRGESSAYNYMYRLMDTAVKASNAIKQPVKEIVRVPVCYDPSFGIDLMQLSTQKQLSIHEIIQLHCSTVYRVYMLGFLPGFAYMGKVNGKIATPRKAIPEKKVAAGSVGIADHQTGIYSFDSPGGWNIIGRTPLHIFDAEKKEPCLFQPGDKVKFEPVSLEQFYQLKKQ